MATMGYGYGSEWHLLLLLGHRRDAFTRLIEETTGCEGIAWRDRVEYLDDETDRLKLRETKGLEFLASGDPAREEWERSWPQSGNVHNWDAVGRAKTGTWILVEAKAHLGELRSHCSAKAEESIRKIRTVLDRAKADLLAQRSEWTTDYYQYCNRVALLHFLIKKGVDARLVFVYFVGDRADLGRAGRVCPTDEAGWQKALTDQDAHVGLPTDAAIRQRIHKVFPQAYPANVAPEILKPEFARLSE
jgi:hypothetical protein